MLLTFRVIRFIQIHIRAFTPRVLARQSLGVDRPASFQEIGIPFRARVP